MPTAPPKPSRSANRSRRRGRALIKRHQPACWRLRLGEDAQLRIAVQRPRRGRWTSVRVVTRSVRAGARRVASGACARPGRYRLAIHATDAARNASARRLVRVRIRG